MLGWDVGLMEPQQPDWYHEGEEGLQAETSGAETGNALADTLFVFPRHG